LILKHVGAEDAEVLCTERCRLASLSVCHAADVCRLYCHEDVQEYLGGVMGDKNAFDMRFQDILNDKNAHNWTVTLNESDVFIGWVCIDLHHDKTDHEVSFKFLPEFWGQGFTHEAVHASVKHARAQLNFDSIVAEIQQDNNRAKRFLEKLGFQKERALMRHGEKQNLYRKTF